MPVRLSGLGDTTQDQCPKPTGSEDKTNSHKCSLISTHMLCSNGIRDWVSYDIFTRAHQGMCSFAFLTLTYLSLLLTAPSLLQPSSSTSCHIHTYIHTTFIYNNECNISLSSPPASLVPHPPSLLFPPRIPYQCANVCMCA